MAKEGSTISGLMDSFATAVSLSLQHGVPLKVLCEKFAHTRFEPSGWTGNEQIGYAKSIMDYLFRWMQLRFLSGTQLDLFAGLNKPAEAPALAPNSVISTGAERSGETPVLSAGPATIADPWSNEPGAPLHADRDPTPARHRPGANGLTCLLTTVYCLASPSKIAASSTPPTPLKGNVRHGRRPQLLHLRRHHGPQRRLPPLHGMRLHQRLQLKDT